MQAMNEEKANMSSGEQSSSAGPAVEGLIQKAYSCLKDADGEAAFSFLQEALKIDYDHPEVLYALKCLSWWLERIKKLEDSQDPFEQGGFLISQWKAFNGFLDRLGQVSDSCLYAMRHFVFSRALGFFRSLLGEGANQQDPGLLFLVGRCFKGIGNYDEAVKYLEQASRFRREDSATLSELADVNALLNDTRAAKVLFREAFFLDPQGIDLLSMESEMIIRLRDKVKELGFSGPQLAEWIPVYGCIWGVFSIKRELKPVELGRLKQAVLTLESELRSRPEGNELVKPRLINRYFWLIDHYGHVRDKGEMVEQTMLKIKFIDPAVYDLYRN
jgi:tetratricopeptide (TPR) repeat protein